MLARRHRLAAAALLVGAVILGGIGVHGSASADTVALRVGYFPNITHAQAVLGFGLGTFTKDLPGVNVTSQIFNAGPAEMTALYAGAIDIGYIGPGPAINGFVKSKGAVVIVAGASTGGAELVVRTKAGISSLKDLDGKRVAVPQLGNTQDIELRALLKDNGLAPTDKGGTVQIIATDNANTLLLFKRGDLDAALVPEPWGTRLVLQTKARILLDWNQIYGGTLPAAVVIVAKTYLQAHPDVVVKFLRAHIELTQDLGHKDAVYAPLYAQLEKLTGKGIPKGALTGALQRTFFTTSIDPAVLQRFAAYSQAAGYLKKGANLTGLVDLSPLTQASKQ